MFSQQHLFVALEYIYFTINNHNKYRLSVFLWLHNSLFKKQFVNQFIILFYTFSVDIGHNLLILDIDNWHLYNGISFNQIKRSWGCLNILKFIWIVWGTVKKWLLATLSTKIFKDKTPMKIKALNINLSSKIWSKQDHKTWVALAESFRSINFPRSSTDFDLSTLGLFLSNNSIYLFFLSIFNFSIGICRPIYLPIYFLILVEF